MQKSEIKICVWCINTALTTDYPQIGRKDRLWLKYQKPHSTFLTLNSPEEQFTPPRKEKLLDVESKTLIRTDAQHLGNNLDTGEKKIISSPHDVAAENRSKSIRQRSPAGTKNGEDFHIQRRGEKGRQLTDRQKKDVNDFFCINLSNSSKTFTAPLDCLPGFEPCLPPLNVGKHRLVSYLQGFACPPCTIHSQTPSRIWFNSLPGTRTESLFHARRC